MFSFLRTSMVHEGLVCFPGSIAPPAEQFTALRSMGVDVTPVDAPAPFRWALELRRPGWDAATLLYGPGAPVPASELIDHAFALADDERTAARSAGAALLVRLTTKDAQVLRARKRLLRWLHAIVQFGGVMAYDMASQLIWSPAMLDDELAHDADLDIESLYTIHAVYDQDHADRQVLWLHTHGLEELGAFDFDILRPSPLLSAFPADPIRALAFAALEGAISPSTSSFVLAMPGGKVRLVPAREFDAGAAPADAALRSAEDGHDGTRTVICDPVGGLRRLFSARPSPSRFLSTVQQDVVYNFTAGASRLMAERARQTYGVFRDLLGELAPRDLPMVAKLGYPTASDPDGREHLWFHVHAADDTSIDGTLANQPFDVPHLKEGDRGRHDVALLSDWMILTPFGPITPRHRGALRSLRTPPAAGAA